MHISYYCGNCIYHSLVALKDCYLMYVICIIMLLYYNMSLFAIYIKNKFLLDNEL